ncbi:serine hydrolase domain-containing protein [Aeromicrobium chenweiae]|uniref:Serine hydrolase n=1 Tax=Aeromicrobium chenweiae TaxID=2079793 RepID=A0A2S0WN14_9ACTN|nr:serine hydrolase domain-containing protein [Aeromicrobium chenweiae]AWB92660.1 serine hydrolase [Aeromicrobium chenweiae]TGN33648.1 class A beta-lactamase-related serine hydrolase [Aeromicrobium chenweiae]
MRTRLAASGVVLMVLAGCAGGNPGGSEPPRTEPTRTRTTTPSAPTTSATPDVAYPGATWARAEQGDWKALDADLAANGSTCVAVVKDGRLVHDAYWNGGDPQAQQKVYSIAKSLTSLLVGTYVDDGLLDLDAPAAQQVDEWRRTAAGDITVRDLLAMTSGRHWDDATDTQMIRSEPDTTSFAVDVRQDRAPGEAWVYDNTAVQTLEAVLDGLEGSGDVVANAEQRLLGPLGMRATTWGRDPAGNALTFSGMTSTCLDLARVGHLMLNDGAWKGRQLLSADFVREATRPSSRLNAAYGLLWWVNAEGRVVEVLRQAGFATDKAPYDGRLAPNVPDDAFWAFGYGNQYVAVVPSEGVVAVRLGARPATPDRVTFDGFTADVLAALDE